MPKGSSAEKEKKRRTVAKGLVSGTPLQGIARAAGCQPRYVQRLAAEPETQLLIAEALRPYHAQLRRAVPKALRAIERGLVARRTDLSDHYTQLRAVEKLEDYLKMAQGKPTESAVQTEPVTWEQFTVMYQKRQESHGSVGNLEPNPT
jgi:hypothetical protein